MHTHTPRASDARAIAGGRLAAALREARARTLLHLSHWREVAPPDGRLPLHPHFNPPAWEAGHVAWFQEFWIARNPQRELGAAADPECARHAARLEGADGLYHSGQVAHDLRWSLPLPDAARLQAYLEQTLDDSLAALAGIGDADRDLYFHRLALFHEDMHAEAQIYMANHYGAAAGADTGVFAPAAPHAPRAPAAPRELAIAAGPVTLGHTAAGFAFDNELPPQTATVDGFDIDRRLVSVGEYWQFVAAGGYRERRWWSPEGWALVGSGSGALPRFHRERGGAVERCRFGRWQPLDAAEAMLHVTAHEAEAWCRWAGRALPSEAQWMRAAANATGFEWGEAWEWTGDRFDGFTGFIAHPYRDYSQPWFGDHRLLKGASLATDPRMRAPAYRNFYLPGRNDIFCGFRSCSRTAA